nr:transposase [Oceanidesulfovibrio indonesiensis]
MLSCLFSLPFHRLNLYRYFAPQDTPAFGKDAVYEFMRSSRYSWRRFLLLLAARVCSMLQDLTSEERETVLILDDSTLQRPRSKKVELLARVFDHTQNSFLKGYRLLSLCWSDGATLAPLDFALLSSAKEKNRYQGVTKLLDSRTCGARRRKEAICKATELIGPMLKRALTAGVQARYLLMDSWFGMPAIISHAREHIHVICMVKRTPKVLYGSRANA